MNPRPPSRFEQLILSLIYFFVAVLVLLLIATSAVRLALLLEDREMAEGQDPAFILARAEDAIDSVDLLLGTLEGASVLVVLALGAAGVIGYRNNREMREEFEQTAQQVTDLLEREMQTITKLRDEVETYRPAIEQLPRDLAALQTERARLNEVLQGLQPSMANLMLATQELSLRNYEEAHRYALNVLALAPDNVQALYIAGWLEIQYVPNALSAGAERLKRATEIDPEWPSARAAYGLALRRQAAHVPHNERTRTLDRAEGQLLSALGDNPHLLDFNRESFWGSLGGIRWDRDDYNGAMAAYRQALDVTPGSSYPMGNLATLYMKQAYDDGSDDYRAALDAFAKTDQYARAELVLAPNDYYLMMDIAMANMMLGQRDAAHFAESETWQQISLGIDMPCGPLEVSLRGWSRLLDYCPPSWGGVHTRLSSLVKELKETLAALDCR